MTLASTALSVRERAGWTRREIAAGSRVSPDRLSRWERGLQALTTDSADRVAEELNIHHVPVDGRLASTLDASLEIRELLAGDGVQDAYVVLADFGHGLAAATSAIDRAVLCAAPPVGTGDSHFDAALAAIAELRLAEVGIAPPGWAEGVAVAADARSLGQVWLPEDITGTPPSILARGVILPLSSIEESVVGG